MERIIKKMCVCVCLIIIGVIVAQNMAPKCVGLGGEMKNSY